jgi:hypothetical protein
MTIPYDLRRLLTEDSVIELVGDIDRISKKEKKFRIFPKEMFECFNTAFADESLYNSNPKTYQEIINSCSDSLENEFIELILKSKLIRGKFTSDEDGYPILIVNKVFRAKFNLLVKWIKNKKYIVERGVFSLNTLSGEAYFKDKLTKFRSGSGYYKLFKEMLISKKKYLTYEEIVNIHFGKKVNWSELEVKPEAIRHIQELKKKLGMKDGHGKLFVMFEGKGYLLLTEES